MKGAKHVISIEAGDVLVDGEKIGASLTGLQERFLRAIMSAKGVASKEYLMSAVYAGRDEPDMKIVDSIICILRRKLGSHRVAIETAWGRGVCAHPEYEMAAPANSVGLSIDTELFGELLHITGEQPDALVTRLLKAEQERLWA